MSQGTLSPLDFLRSAGGRWWSQVRALFVDRYALAELEIRSDIDAGKRLGVVGGIGVVLALSGLPVLMVVLGTALGEATIIDAVWWQLGLGLVSIVAGLAIAWLSWRRFRREFAGLRETLEELREDAAWLREMGEEMAFAATGVESAEDEDDQAEPT